MSLPSMLLIQAVVDGLGGDNTSRFLSNAFGAGALVSAFFWVVSLLSQSSNPASVKPTLLLSRTHLWLFFGLLLSGVGLYSYSVTTVQPEGSAMTGLAVLVGIVAAFCFVMGIREILTTPPVHRAVETPIDESDPLGLFRSDVHERKGGE